MALKKFLIDNTNSSLNSNVYFYIGDIYFHNQEYMNAAVNFYKGYQFDSQGPRSDSNIMMLLKSFNNMGRLSDTCKLCQYIERNHNSLPSLMKRELYAIKNATKCNFN